MYNKRNQKLSFSSILVGICLQVSPFFLSSSVASETAALQVKQTAPMSPIAARLDNKQSLTSRNELIRNAAKFYKNRNFEFYWYDGNRLSRKAENVLKTLQAADREGLDPNDYKPVFAAIEKAKEDPTKLVDAEIAITAYALEYIDDLFGERLNPRKVNKTLYIKQKDIDAVSIAETNLQSDNSWGWYTKLTVSHPEYQTLKQELAKAMNQSETVRYPVLSLGPKIELGVSNDRVKIVQRQLTALGFLVHAFTEGKVDQVTDQAIRAFQRDHNLKVDGIVGPKTSAMLNSFNMEDRIQKLIVSMERWRWMPNDLGPRYIRVNIAGFELYAVDEYQERLRMPVIIGRQYRKTPVFSSEIYSIRFNPSWHVPRSIAVKDKLKKIRRDPSYLTRGGYVLYDSSGSRLSPHSVDWSSVNGSNFNYRLRQVPGRNNALGKIRFSIKSPFNVYLHDTNERHLFTKSNRSLSSGCIRVQDPNALATFVFNDSSNWPRTRVDKNMEGTRTSNVPVKDPVKVYITYFTVFTGENGDIRYVPDIYGQDKSIWDALQSRKGHRL